MLRYLLSSLLFLSTNAHSFTTCSSTSPVIVNSITLTPDNIVSGKNLVINIEASADSVYNQVQANLVVHAFGVQLLSQSFPVSDLKGGDNTISISQDIPSSVPTGLTLDAKVNLVSGTKNLACLELEVKTSSSGLRATDTVAYLYEHWTNFHGKEKKDSELMAFRMNHKKVSENRIQYKEGKVSHLLGLNKFAGMTSEEFRGVMGLKAVPKIKSDLKFIGNKIGVSEDIDWVSKGFVLYVRDQKQSGTCWGHSTTACASSAFAITNGQMYDFSVQEIVDCVTSKYGYQSEGTQGGIPSEALDFLVKNGAELTKDYPYTQRDGTCGKSKHTVVAKFSQYIEVESNSQDTLLEALNQQPISVAIHAEGTVQLYTSGIIMEKDCQSDSLDHAVLLVGSGSENGTKYWKIQNSWGTSYGEEGYFRLQRSSGTGLGTCGITTEPIYIVAEKTNSNDFISVM